MIITFPRLNPIIFNESPLPALEQCNDVFIQEWDKSDYIVFQVSHSWDNFKDGDIAAEIIDDDGYNDRIEYDHIAIDATSYQTIFRIGCNGIPEGFYRIQVYDKAGTFIFYSNVFHIGNHKNNLLVEYCCSSNKFDCIFTTDQYAFFYMLRVSGGVKSSNVSYKSDDVVFIDQCRSVKLIDSIPYIVRKYTLGGDIGLPCWLADRINRALSCDNLLINGLKVVKNDGSSLEATTSDAYPYVGLNIDLLQQNERNSETLYNDKAFMQSGFDVEIIDREQSYTERPPRTGKIHIETFENTFN